MQGDQEKKLRKGRVQQSIRSRGKTEYGTKNHQSGERDGSISGIIRGGCTGECSLSETKGTCALMQSLLEGPFVPSFFVAATVVLYGLSVPCFLIWKRDRQKKAKEDDEKWKVF